MGRFGKQHRDQSRRDARAQMNLPTQALYIPDKTDCETFRQTVELEDLDFRLKQRLVRCNGKLVEFALILTRFQGYRWVEVYSIDSEHGMLHEHTSGHQRQDDRRDIRALYTQVDVQDSFDDPATRMVYEMYRRLRS